MEANKRPQQAMSAFAAAHPTVWPENTVFDLLFATTAVNNIATDGYQYLRCVTFAWFVALDDSISTLCRTIAPLETSQRSCTIDCWIVAPSTTVAASSALMIYGPRNQQTKTCP